MFSRRGFDMCRILIMFGSREKILGVRSDLIKSLINSAEKDPYLEALTGYKEHSHSDGWGRILVSLDKKGVVREYYERSLKPFYKDNRALRLPEDLSVDESVVIEMIHVRAASRGMPINIFSTHPAEAISREGYRLYLIHNGTVDKNRVLELLGIDRESLYANLYGDTYFLAQLMASRVREGLSIDIFREAAELTISALNIGVVLVKDREVEVGVGSYYVLRGEDSSRKNYYKIYRIAEEPGLYVYTSSTLVDFYNPAKGCRWSEIPNGFFEAYRIYVNKDPVIEKIFEFRYE
ncbi:MAG: hypothetical protein ABWJ42_06565 [Sulfolobales archaeon]